MINGKPIDQIEDELREEFPESDFEKEKTKFEYLPVEKLEERLDKVIGKFNYDRLVSDRAVLEAGNTRTVTVKMTLVFYDDERKIFIKKSAYGGADLQLNANGNAVSIKQAVAAAESDAFKHCCQTLGIGAKQLREKNYNDKNEKKINIVLRSGFKKTEDYIKAQAAAESGKEAEFIIFKDAFETFEKKCSLEKLMSCRPGTRFTFMGVEKSYKNKAQIIFKDHI